MAAAAAAAAGALVAATAVVGCEVVHAPLVISGRVT
jgi:hypothetical protein